MICLHFRKAWLFLLVSILMASAQLAYGAIHLSIAGSASTATFEQTHQSRAASGSVSMDLGTYFRLGLTHRQEYSDSEGYELTEDPATKNKLPVYSKTFSHVISNSLDLTIILYDGQLFVPYIFGGMVVKQIKSLKKTETESLSSSGTLPPMPHGGVGLGIALSRDFSLKISHTLSPGLKLLPTGTYEQVTDSYTSVGISYKI